MQVSKLLNDFSKRQRFAFLTVVVTLGLVATQLISRVEYYFPLSGLLSVVGGVIALVIFSEDIRGIRRFAAMMLITLYTLSVSFFYFLLPVRWLTRLPTAILFAVGFYAILLTENIFNVAASRTIQLLRAARSIGLLMSLITAFLLFETIISLRLNPFYSGGLVALASYPLVFHNLWYMELEPGLNTRLLFQAFMLTLVVAQVAVSLLFWPADATLQALFLTSFFYLVVGVVQQEIIERLFPKTVKEFVAVSLIVFLLLFFTTSW